MVPGASLFAGVALAIVCILAAQPATIEDWQPTLGGHPRVTNAVCRETSSKALGRADNGVALTMGE